jgi:hypothetical protein
VAREIAQRRDLVDAVAGELARHGAAETAAAELAREVIGRYPLVGRLGLAGAVREARRAGLERSVAEESAIWLAAWEALRRGIPYGTALAELEAMCGDGLRARAALLEASRFLRNDYVDADRDLRERAAVRAALGRRAAQALLILLAAAGWVALGGRWLASL